MSYKISHTSPLSFFNVILEKDWVYTGTKTRPNYPPLLESITFKDCLTYVNLSDICGGFFLGFFSMIISNNMLL